MVIIPVVVAVAILCVSSNRPIGTIQTIKIGVIAPLSGNVAFLGEGVRDAVKMAESEINASTSNKWHYEVIVEDDGFDVAKTVSAANKLISIAHVSALITLASAAGNAVNPIAEQKHIIHFGIASDPHVADGYYNFTDWTPPYEETKVFVPELKKHGYHRIAVFGAKIQGITAVIDSLDHDILNTDIKKVDQEMFDFGTSDFRTMIAKAEMNHPDIYVLFAFSPELDLIVKQLKEKGVIAPITSIESFEQSDHPDLYEGDWYVNAADTTGAFNSSFKAKYGKAPSLGAGNAYDIVHLIADAAEKVDSGIVPTSEQITEKLYTISDVDGALGKLSIDADGVVDSKAVVRMIKGGVPVTIER